MWTMHMPFFKVLSIFDVFKALFSKRYRDIFYLPFGSAAHCSRKLMVWLEQSGPIPLFAIDCHYWHIFDCSANLWELSSTLPPVSLQRLVSEIICPPPPPPPQSTSFGWDSSQSRANPSLSRAFNTTDGGGLLFATPSDLNNYWVDPQNSNGVR